MKRQNCYIICIVLLFVDIGFAQPDYEIDIGSFNDDGIEIFYVLNELLIKPMPSSDVSSIAFDLGGTLLDSIPRIGWYRIRFPQDTDVVPMSFDLADDSRLRNVALNRAYPLDETDSETPGQTDPPDEQRDEIQWPITITDADQAWSQVPQKTNTLISILDTGCDTDHPEYARCSRISYGYDWTDAPSYLGWPEDYHGHGTRRLGEIAAPYGNGEVAGINQNCRIRVEKVFTDDTYNPNWLLWAVALALDDAAFIRGARVVNCSFGGATSGHEDFLLLRDAFINVNDNSPGTVIICSSGNSGYGNSWKDRIEFPAAWSCSLNCVIAVGASTPLDSIDYCTEWRPGQYGGQLNILGPGKYGTYRTTNIGGGYTWNTGKTSGGAAHVSGVAGMLISKYPWLQNEEIKSRLMDSAWRLNLRPTDGGWNPDDPDCWNPPHWCWNERAGCGRIDALYCLNSNPIVRCGSSAFELSPIGDTGYNSSRILNGGVEVGVYDILGRRLLTFSLNQNRVDKEFVQNRIHNLAGTLPVGPKIVRAVSPTEVVSWKLVP